MICIKQTRGRPAPAWDYRLGCLAAWDCRQTCECQQRLPACSSVERTGKQLAILTDQPGLILREIEYLDHQFARAGAQGAAVPAHRRAQTDGRGIVALAGDQALAQREP